MTTRRLVALLISILGASVLLTSCGQQQAKRAALQKQAADDLHEIALIDGYYSSDINKAEQSLLGLAEHYSGKRFEAVHGVEGTRALTHTRLYFLYSQTQRTNDAAAQRLDALRLYRGAPEETEQERWAELLRAVEALDKNREVKWKPQK